MKIDFLKIAGDYKGNFERYLGAYLRDDFFKHIGLKTILDPLADKASGALKGLDREFFFDHMIDRFIDDEQGEYSRAMIRGHIKDKFKATKEIADKIVSPSGHTLNEEEKTLLKDAAKEFGPLLYNQMRSFFKDKTMEYIRLKGKEEPLTEGQPDPSVPAEHVIEKDIREKHEWEKGLIKDILDLINREVKDKDRRIGYKAILKDRFLKKDRVSLEDLAKSLQVPMQTLHGWEKQLIALLKPFLKAQGLGGRFLEEGGLERKEIEVPPYQEAMKNPDNSKDFLEWLELDPQSNEKTKKVINLLAHGKGIPEIVTESGESVNNVRVIKHRYFDSNYETWYKEMVNEIRKATYRVRLAMLLTAAPKMTPEELKKFQQFTKQFKKPPKPEPKRHKFFDAPATPAKPAEPGKAPAEAPAEEKEGPSGEGSMAIHKKMVENAIKDSKHLVTVYFSSDYDAMDVQSGRKEIGKDDPHFKYIAYEASMDLERMIGKKPHNINFVYKRRLKDNGDFEGEGVMKLIINKTPIKSDDEVYKLLDTYMKDEVLPEGVIPHGRIRVKYVNEKKPAQTIHNIHTFRNLYPEGIGGSDSAHKNRLEKYDLLQVRKKRGPGLIPATEKEQLMEMKIRLERKLKTETKQKKELQDSASIEKLKKEIKEIDDMLKGHVKKDIEEVEKILEEEKMLRDASFDITAQALPPPQSPEAKEFVQLLLEYKADRPNPSLWMDSDDVEVAARVLRAGIEHKLEADIKGLKKEKLKPEDRESRGKELETKAAADKKRAVSLLEPFIKDLKDRRNQFKEKHPADYESLTKRKDTTWVDNNEKVKRLIDKVKSSMMEEHKDDEKLKQKTLRIIEKNKYKTLEAFLSNTLDDIRVMADRLKQAKMTPGASKDTQAEIQHEKGKLSDSVIELRKVIQELTNQEDISTEDQKYLKELDQESHRALQQVRDIDKQLGQVTKVPAAGFAFLLKNFIDYFSKIYSEFSNFHWFKDLAVHRAAADEVIEEKEKPITLEGLTSLRDKIVAEAISVSQINIWADDLIKKGLTKLKFSLKKFYSDFDRLKTAEGIIAAEPEPKERDTWEEALVKFLFPEGEMALAKKTIGTLSKKLQPIAEKELEKMTKNVSDAFKEGIPEERIDALAKKENLNKEQAAIRLKKLQNSLAKTALDTFITNWQNVKQVGMKKERSPLGNKHPSEYDEMGLFVERHLPDLFKLTPPVKEPEEPTKGIPTPPAIRKLIEDKFGRGKPGEMKEVFQDECDEWDMGGGGGKKSKHRAKAVKIPPPSGTKDELKERVIHLFKTRPANDVVLTVMAYQVKKLRDALKNIKDEEYIDIEDTIDSFVYLLKNLYQSILNLRALPSATEIKLPPITAPKSSGGPDIVIDNYKEAESAFNKVVAIYDEINRYIKPDKVGVPPENISEVRTRGGIAKRYLPIGLGETAQHWWEKEHGGKEKKEPETKKEASVLYDFPSAMSLNIAQKFSSLDELGSEFSQIIR